MKQRIKVYDYATRIGAAVSTVYRHIKLGKLESETIDDVTYVLVDYDESNTNEIPNDIIIELKDRIEHQENEIEYLRHELSEARQTIQQIQQDSAESQQRSDTIILQFTRQFEQQTVLLEDMRNRSSFWKRLKMGLVRFATPSATEQSVTEQRN